MKNDINLFLSAVLLCLFWYGIFIYTGQALAAVLSFICGILAMINLSYLIADAFILMKSRLVHATDNLKRKNFIEKLMHIRQ